MAGDPGHQVEQSLEDRVGQKRPPRVRPSSTRTIGQNLQPDTSRYSTTPCHRIFRVYSLQFTSVK